MVFLACVPAVLPGQDDGARWPQFRGPFARGVGAGPPVPTSWDLESGENVAWQAEIPGLAHSSPIVWGDRVFVTTSVRDGGGEELKVGLYGDIAPVEDDAQHEFRLLCLDRKTGEILWSKTAFRGVPAIARHPKGSHAASTPAVDAERVVAFFGSEGLFAFDHDGEPLWDRQFGVLDSGFYMVEDAQWGFASSPVLHEGKVYVQVDVQGDDDDFVACLDAATGETVWRQARDEVPTWCTPTVDVTGDRRRLLVNGYRHIGGYDLDTGEQVWALEGGGDIPVPTPVVDGGRVFITNAHGRMAPILAIDMDAEGELSLDPDECEHLHWAELRRGNYMQTPIAHAGLLYCCRDNGSLAVYDQASGELAYRERLGGGRTGFTASGVLSGDAVFFPSEVGEIYVVRAGRTFEVLGEHDMGEPVMATPAIAAGMLLIRTRSKLVAIAAGS